MTPYYQDDAVTIYYGDCREWMPAADVIVTDPPYGGAPYGPEVDEWLPLARSIGPVATFCGVRYIWRYPEPTWVLAWARPASVQRNGSLRGFNNWEPILLYGVEALANDLILVPHTAADADFDHPTPKPLRLMTALLGRMPSGSVLDPFAGSGTTLVAAKSLNRKAIGIEIEERYCEIAAKRCSQEVLGLSA